MVNSFKSDVWVGATDELGRSDQAAVEIDAVA